MPPMAVRAAAYPATQDELLAKPVALFAVHLTASLSFPTGERSGLRATMVAAKCLVCVPKSAPGWLVHADLTGQVPCKYYNVRDNDAMQCR